MVDLGQCLLCAGPCSLHLALCQACCATLPHQTGCCPRCGIGRSSDVPAELLCGACLQHPPAFDRCLALGRYEFPLAQLIARFKFQGLFSAGLALSLIPSNRLEAEMAAAPPDALVPVPLHPGRLSQRGFNQSAEIAGVLASELRVPLILDLCRRVRATPAQKGLRARERALNLRDAFYINAGRSLPQHLWLVDDVVTTMATTHEIARSLKNAGARRVDVICLARVQQDSLA